ncbi:exonuclease domain-containing protein [Agaribacter flavus]|uniref:DNA-directed DNA polymerase n=1 Tax=Agaribacter flavus TaxID=1902781 RepID=A0ABV7FRJ8_9ALTE
MRELPTYYYLEHFNEFLSYIVSHNKALLGKEHHAFIEVYSQASHDEKCLLVRCINRKHPFILTSSLRFSELSNITKLITSLQEKGWLRSVTEADALALLEVLTKQELHQLHEECVNVSEGKTTKLAALAPKKSASKADWLSSCKRLPVKKITLSATAKAYVARNADPVINYFLFLYFGNCRDRLNQFSMRDLGVLKTREVNTTSPTQISRYTSKEQAMTLFRLHTMLREEKHFIPDSAKQIDDLIEQLPVGIDAITDELQHKLLYRLALKLLPLNRTDALSHLFNCKHPAAQEKWCREIHKDGDLKALEKHLLAIIKQPIDERLLLFAQDFLARKFQKKRTSVLTDMLRHDTRQLTLDEVHKGRVEQGLVELYRSQGHHAFVAENNLWRGLFGLTFWKILFANNELGLLTEFDFLPECLKQNNFYDTAHDEIENVLSSLSSSLIWKKHILSMASKELGKTQYLFRWSTELIDSISLVLDNTDISHLKTMLRSMAKDWRRTRDGFPDLVVSSPSGLRFEEVKAEGDSLRRNQLLRIQQLREAGIHVHITTVDFNFDPQQVYAVVDIETTGGRAANHKITEIGIVKIRNGEVIDQWQSLINPMRRIPNKITELTGIDNQLVADAPIFADIAEKLDAFTENSIFVAHNVNFDYGFIREEFSRIGRVWRRPKLCTVQQMRKYYKGLRSYSLANLCQHFNIAMSQHHRAMSDAYAASELLRLVQAKKQNASTS